MSSLRLKVCQPFSALHLAVVTLPSSCDPALQGASRVFLLNCVNEIHLDSSKALPSYHGSILFGRKPSCDIVLKDRAISTSHGQLMWRVEPETDTVEVTMEYRDTSSNGSYLGDARLPQNTLNSVSPVLFQTPNDANPFLDPAQHRVFHKLDEQAIEAGCLFLGKPRSTQGATKPVCGCVIGIVISAPYHSTPLTMGSYLLPPFGKFCSSFDTFRIMPPKRREPVSAANARRMVKSEPGRMFDNSVYDVDAMSDQTRLLEQIQELQTSRDSANRTLQQVRAELQRAKKDLSVAQADSKKHALKLTELETELREAHRTGDLAKRTFEQKRSELEFEKNLSEKKLSSFQEKISQLQRKYDEVLNEKSTVSDELDRSELKRTQVASQLETVELRCSELEKRLLTAESELSRCQGELAALRSDSSARSQEMERLSRHLEEAEHNLKRATSKSAKAVKQRDAAVTKLARLETEGKQRGEELQRLTQEFAKLETCLKESFAKAQATAMSCQKHVMWFEEINKTAINPRQSRLTMPPETRVFAQAPYLWASGQSADESEGSEIDTDEETDHKEFNVDTDDSAERTKRPLTSPPTPDQKRFRRLSTPTTAIISSAEI